MMQSAGQYGATTEVPQFLVGRPSASPHMFSLSHEMSLSTPTAHGHLRGPHVHARQHEPQQQQPQLFHHHQQHQSLQSQQTVHETHAQAPQSKYPAYPQPIHHLQLPIHAQHVQHASSQRAQAAAQLTNQANQQVAQQPQSEQQLGLESVVPPEHPSPIVSGQVSLPSSPKQVVPGGEGIGQDDEGEEDELGRSIGAANRWPRQETLALIKIRSDMDANFRDSGLKGPLWEAVARKLAELGYTRSAKKCKEKFENIHKYYKKTKDGRAGRQDGKNYRFFSQLDALYGGQSTPAQPDGGVTLLVSSAMHVVASRVADVSLSAHRPAEQPRNDESPLCISESSEDDSNQAIEEAAQGNKKRKREAGNDRILKVGLFERLVRMMDKQEEMQKRFFQAIERRDQDRVAREEVWIKQEMVRLQREYELRAQEHSLSVSRDAALVAFLQKFTGQTLQLPQFPAPVAPTPAFTPAAAAVVTEHQTAPSASHSAQTIQDFFEKDVSIDFSSKRWPKSEVQHLIRLRSSMEPRFQEACPKGPLWEEISASLISLGYDRSAKRCKEKWENINKYFKKTKESNKKRPENAKTCPYFDQLDALYRRGELSTPISKMKYLGEGSKELTEHLGDQANGGEI